MEISENVIKGLKEKNLTPVVNYLETNEKEVVQAVESVLNLEAEPNLFYNAMLAVALCKKKGTEIFTTEVNEMYDKFVEGLRLGNKRIECAVKRCAS